MASEGGSWHVALLRGTSALILSVPKLCGARTAVRVTDDQLEAAPMPALRSADGRGLYSAVNRRRFRFSILRSRYWWAPPYGGVHPAGSPAVCVVGAGWTGVWTGRGGPH